MTSYPVNCPKSTFTKLICIRKVVSGCSNGAELELQGFYTCYFVHSFTRETSLYIYIYINDTGAFLAPCLFLNVHAINVYTYNRKLFMVIIKKIIINILWGDLHSRLRITCQIFGE